MTLFFSFLALLVLGAHPVEGPAFSFIPADPVASLTLHSRTESGVLRHQEASQFDLGGRVTEVITTMPGSPALILTQAYTYSVRGERLSHTVNGTLLTTNTFDDLGHLLRQTDGPSGTSTTLTYDPAGRRTLLVHAHPVAGTLRVTSAYDAAGHLQAWGRFPAPGEGGVDSAAYDPAHRLQFLTLASGDLRTYTYDSQARLTGVTGELSSGNAAYGFDPTGNLVSSRVGGGAPTHTWAPADAGNRLGLRTSSPLEVVYDPAGRLINFDPTGFRRTVFTYSPQDELLTVTPIEGTPVTRRYDALGRVYEENTVRKVYDGAQVLFDGEVRRRWGSLDEPWGTVDSTLAVTHQSVNFLGHAQDLGAFGESPEFFSGGLGFHGRPQVGASSQLNGLVLWDHRARIYMPELKRFLTEDPHGLWGMNQYSYGGNDPVNFRDPSGLWAESGVNFATGVADAASFGLGPWARKLTGGQAIDMGSGQYFWGYAAGTVGTAALSVGKSIAGFASAGGRVFYSGAKGAATAFAKEQGMRTIQMTTQGELMTAAARVLPNAASKYLWQELSKDFARGVAGQANFFTLRTGAIPNSVWLLERIELIKRGIPIIYHIVP